MDFSVNRTVDVVYKNTAPICTKTLTSVTQALECI